MKDGAFKRNGLIWGRQMTLVQFDSTLLQIVLASQSQQNSCPCMMCGEVRKENGHDIFSLKNHQHATGSCFPFLLQKVSEAICICHAPVSILGQFEIRNLANQIFIQSLLARTQWDLQDKLKISKVKNRMCCQAADVNGQESWVDRQREVTCVGGRRPGLHQEGVGGIWGQLELL